MYVSQQTVNIPIFQKCVGPCSHRRLKSARAITCPLTMELGNNGKGLQEGRARLNCLPLKEMMYRCSFYAKVKGPAGNVQQIRVLKENSKFKS